MFNMRRWDIIHRWSSLICTISLLILCITGLPLIFHEEIETLNNRHPAVTKTATDAPAVNLDHIIKAALAYRPGLVVQYVSFDEEGIVSIATGPATDADPNLTKYDFYDANTGIRIDSPVLTEGVMWFLLKLHKDLFLGVAGTLFIGVMGMSFILSLISGVVLYAPFMRKLNFGEVRLRSSKQLKWLDLHNLLGIVTLSWALVVGVTGVINALSAPIIALWQISQLAEMTAPYQDAEPVIHLSSIASAVNIAQKEAPNTEPFIIAYPGTPYSSKHHYAVFMRGKTPLTKRLYTPALIDAETGMLTAMRTMPWYVSMLFVSQPLHFGDYGGLPLKLIWAIFDIITIIILGSGVYLWLKRWRNPTKKTPLSFEEV